MPNENKKKQDENGLKIISLISIPNPML